MFGWRCGQLSFGVQNRKFEDSDLGEIAPVVITISRLSASGYRMSTSEAAVITKARNSKKRPTSLKVRCRCYAA
jgi:hypothetical protein